MSTTAAAAPAQPASAATSAPGLSKCSVLYLLALILVVFSLWIPETFLSTTTFKIVLGDQVVIGILGLAVLVPLTAGAFDLSAGAMLAFGLVIMSWFQQETQLNWVLAALIAIVACGAVGFLSGLIVVKFRVNSFIATLGMSQVLAAATLYISKNRQIVGVYSKSYLDFGRREVFGMPIVVFYLLILAFVIWYVIEHTPLGRHLLASGANPEAARLAGVRTDRMVWGSLVASADGRRHRRDHLRRQGRLVLQLVRSTAAVPRVRRRVLRLDPVQEPGQRVGHDRRGLHAGVRRQGPAAGLQRRRVLDHAAVQRPRTAHRRGLRQPAHDPTAAPQGGG